MQMQAVIADQVDAVHNGSLLHYTRPFERGYLNNWHCEIDIWTRLFSNSSLLPTNPAESCLVLTEPPFAPDALQNDMNEVVFEHFGFRECLRRPASWFSAYEFSQDPPEGTCNPTCCLVLDSGFSFTHLMPFVDVKCQKHAVQRVNVGGKLLTNYLKEVVSYRQWNMMDEFKLMDQVKEELCYVSEDFQEEMRRASRKSSDCPVLDYAGGPLRRQFVLPDFQNINRGFVRPDDAVESADEQVLAMETERFTVPDVLFHPSDVGMDQAGISEAAWFSLSKLSDIEQGLVAANIVLTGGNVNFPQLQHRFYSELRQSVPDIFPMQSYQPPEPEAYAWRGAARFVDNERRSGKLSKQVVTKAQYLENGHHYCNEKFAKSW